MYYICIFYCNFHVGSLPKLRELQINGNPLDYHVRDIMRKGSKNVISYLQEKWKNDQRFIETIQLNDEPKDKTKPVDSKTLKKNNMKNKKAVIILLNY